MTNEVFPTYDGTMVVIDQTLTRWKDIKIEDLGNPCPLCNYIRSRVKLSWHKGVREGTCAYCPVTYSGLLFVCSSINTLRPIDSDIKILELRNVQLLVLQKLKVLNTFFSKPANWTEYINYIEHKKSFRGTIVKVVQEVPTKVKKIIRRKK